jgi:hypothetical protein
MNVKEVPHEPFRYHVQSATDPDQWYLVDLLENKGGGICSCRDHFARRQPALNRGEPKLTPATTCRHVQAATRHLLLTILEDQSKKQ